MGVFARDKNICDANCQSEHLQASCGFSRPLCIFLQTGKFDPWRGQPCNPVHLPATCKFLRAVD